MGPIARMLEEDHERLDRLLDRATTSPDTFDMAAYDEFRVGILRHIGIEEKLLMSHLRAAGGEDQALAQVLREEHSAIASLLVGPPDHALVEELRSIFRVHNPREEGPNGMYEIAERYLGDSLQETFERAQNYPPVPPMPYREGPRVQRTAEAALALARSKKAV